MEIFNPDTGLPVLLRALHVLAGVTWIGLLYYFNVVQVPAFAAYGEEGKARNISIDKLARRALWWFRWSSIVTLVLGLFIIGATKDYMKDFMSAGSSGIAENGAIFDGMIRVDGYLEEPKDCFGYRSKRVGGWRSRCWCSSCWSSCLVGKPSELHLLVLNVVVHGRCSPPVRVLR